LPANEVLATTLRDEIGFDPTGAHTWALAHGGT
jgi:hypothetical protein